MPDLDAARGAQQAALRGAIARAGEAQIGERRLFAIAAEIDSDIMKAVLVRAAGEIGGVQQAVIGDDRQGHSDRPKRAEAGADFALRARRIGQARVGADRRERLAFFEIQSVRAAQQNRRHAGIAFDNHRFDIAFGGDGVAAGAQKIGEGGDGVDAGSGDFFARAPRRRAIERRRRQARAIDIGGVALFVAIDDFLFARPRENHKLVRMAAADRARIGLDHPIAQADAIENPAIGGAHPLVTRAHAVGVDIERIRVFHQKLARAHDAEARANLVAELRLDLIQIKRQLAITVDGGAHDFGDDFLVRGAQAKLAPVAVGEAQQFRAVIFQAPRFAPQFGRLHGRQKHFGGAGGVHLFAHDIRHFARRAPTRGQPRINPARQAANEARAQHQAVAGQFGFGRLAAQSVDEKTRRAHRINPNPSAAQSRPRFVRIPSGGGRRPRRAKRRHCRF